MTSSNATEPVQRTNPRWRWAVPAAVVAAIAGVVGLRPVVADASPTLPPRTAAQLLASLPSAAEHPFSGTITTTARLGLPDLPDSVQGQHAPLSPTSLLTGTHTLRVWYAGPDRQRIALVGQLAEADLIRRGQDVWAWNSDTHRGVHATLPDTPSPGSPALTAPTDPRLLGELTPQRLAEQVLAAIEPTTKVTVDGTASVAGRAAYELVVSPKDDRSLVRDIRLAVDARTSLPLRLEVRSTRSTDPAIESGFTSISYATPSDDVFRAPDVPLTELQLPAHPPTRPPSTKPSDAPRVHGSGWTTVLELPQLPDLSAMAGRGGPPGDAGLQPRPQGKGDTDGGGNQPAVPATPMPGRSGPDVPAPDETFRPVGPAARTYDDTHPSRSETPGSTDVLQQLLRSATPVSGGFGHGRLISTSLLSVLVLDDGRVFVGAVTPATLEQVAASAGA